MAKRYSRQKIEYYPANQEELDYIDRTERHAFLLPVTFRDLMRKRIVVPTLIQLPQLIERKKK